MSNAIAAAKTISVLPMVGTLASPYPRGFKEMLGLSLGHGVRAFALGTSGSFYAHSHKEGQCVDSKLVKHLCRELSV